MQRASPAPAGRNDDRTGRVPRAELEASSRDLWVRTQLGFLAGRRAEAAAAIRRPAHTAEVAAVVAGAAGRPIVPLGAGSGVCGGVLAGGDDLIIDLKRLIDIEVMPEHGVARFGAGVMGRHAEQACNRAGWTIGHFPSSIACSTVGGWVAARGAGQLSSRYGKIEDICVGATAVYADGSIHRAWRGSRELAEWIGNEGTLALITEVWLRIRPLRHGWTFASFVAPELGRAVAFARRAIRQRPVPSLLRVYDPIDSRVALSHSRGGLARRLPWMLTAPRLVRRAGDLLLRRCLVVVGWEGEGPQWRATARAARALGAAMGLKDPGAGPGELWLQRRHDVSFKQIDILRAGYFADTFEVACPWTRVLDVYHAVRAAISPDAVSMAHFSHAYSDGSAIYLSMAGRPEAYDRSWERALNAADVAGATISHHHGLGRLKGGLLARELGGAHAVLTALKDEYDPGGRLNPGCLGLPCAPRLAPPHPVFAGLDRGNGLWQGDIETPLGALEQEVRAAGWTLGVPPASTVTVGEWLRQDLAGVECSGVGGARERLVALSGELQDGTPFSTRVAPRTATGPDLRPRILEQVPGVRAVTLRLRRRPLRFRCLVYEGFDAVAVIRRLATGDVDLWGGVAGQARALVWLPYETPAERARADALNWPGRESAVPIDDALVPGSGERLVPGTWQPWSAVPADAVVIGPGPAGARLWGNGVSGDAVSGDGAPGGGA